MGAFPERLCKTSKEKGWLKITNIALDERDKMKWVLPLLLSKKVAPELGVSYADNQQTFKRYPDSKDVSTAVQHPLSPQDLKDRNSRGLNTTFYVYCGNNFPNQFTFSRIRQNLLIWAGMRWQQDIMVHCVGHLTPGWKILWWIPDSEPGQPETHILLIHRQEVPFAMNDY